MSADTLPQPGDTHDAQTVRASGTLPYSGAPFVVLRHTGRVQLRSIRSAQAEAKRDGREVNQVDMLVHLASLVCRVDTGAGLERVKLDDLLDMDGEDLDALLEPFAESGPKPADPAEVPPSPSS